MKRSNAMSMKIQIEEPLIFSLTGQRANNEDFVYPTAPTSDTRLFMVCDKLHCSEELNFIVFLWTI